MVAIVVDNQQQCAEEYSASEECQLVDVNPSRPVHCEDEGAKGKAFSRWEAATSEGRSDLCSFSDQRSPCLARQLRINKVIST